LYHCTNCIPIFNFVKAFWQNNAFTKSESLEILTRVCENRGKNILTPAAKKAALFQLRPLQQLSFSGDCRDEEILRPPNAPISEFVETVQLTDSHGCENRNQW
jgi:hypothetical protein